MYLKNTIFVKIFFYILLLYMKMTFCPAGTYFLHKLNDMFIFQVQCAIKAQLISEWFEKSPIVCRWHFS